MPCDSACWRDKAVARIRSVWHHADKGNRQSQSQTSHISRNANSLQSWSGALHCPDLFLGVNGALIDRKPKWKHERLWVGCISVGKSNLCLGLRELVECDNSVTTWNECHQGLVSWNARLWRQPINQLYHVYAEQFCTWNGIKVKEQTLYILSSSSWEMMASLWIHYVSDITCFSTAAYAAHRCKLGPVLNSCPPKTARWPCVSASWCLHIKQSSWIQTDLVRSQKVLFQEGDLHLETKKVNQFPSFFCCRRGTQLWHLLILVTYDWTAQ